MEAAAHVTDLWVYPVKSCAGVSRPRLTLTPTGPLLDRRWMFVDDAGHFVSLRTAPRLALIRPRLEGAGAEGGVADESTTLVLEAEGMAPVRLPMLPEAPSALPSEAAGAAGEVVREARVWGSRVEVWEARAAGVWASSFLGRPVHLVHLPATSVRPVTSAAAAPGDSVSLADGFPYLLIGEASRADLEARAGVPLAMARFRPNIVVSGLVPYGEDALRSPQLGGHRFRFTKRCERCVATTVDPTTGATGKEPLKTLARHRRADGKVWFGINLALEVAGTPGVTSGGHPIVGRLDVGAPLVKG